MLGTPGSMDALIEGFGANDSIVLAGSYTTVARSFSGNVMTATGDGSTVAQLTFAPGYDDTNTSGNSSRQITISATGTVIPLPCFVTGTHIATAQGEVAVEQLRVGDQVRTQSGMLRPVRWIGRRTLSRVAPEQFPVCIVAGAFGTDMPARDLYLSVDHCIFCSDALVPVKVLVNGVTVARVPRRRVTYWHVELASHDVLLAERLGVESYLDTGNRHAFAGGTVLQLRPDFAGAQAHAAPCCPIKTNGPAVVAAKKCLLVGCPGPPSPISCCTGPRE